MIDMFFTQPGRYVYSSSANVILLWKQATPLFLSYYEYQTRSSVIKTQRITEYIVTNPNSWLSSGVIVTVLETQQMDG